LSGGFPTPSFHRGGFDSPQFQIDNVSLPFPAGHGVSVSVFFHWGSPFQLDQSGPSFPGDSQLPDPYGFMQGQPQAAAVSQTSATIPDLTADQAALRNDGDPFGPFPTNTAQSFGFPALGTSKSQNGAIEGGRDGAQQFSASALTGGILASADGSPVTAGKESAQDAGGVANVQLEPTVTSLPAQLVSLLDRGALLNGWLDARSEAPAGVDRSSVAGLVGTVHGKIDQQGNASIGRPGLGFAALGSPLADGGPGILPNPLSADLIANVLTSDRGALDRAIDQFFKQVDELDGSGAGGQGPARIVFLTAALAGSFAGLDIVRRRWRRGKSGDDFRAHNPAGGGDHIGFPELPGSWSSRLT
jgi:hypothetical protein